MPLVISDTSYSGKVASSFITKAVTGSDTVQKGLVMIKDGIKKKFTIPKLSVENLVQDRAATPVTAGNINVGGEELDPKDYMIYIEFNPRDFEDHWFAEELDEKLLDRSLPATVESALIQEVLKGHDEYSELAVWRSVEGAANAYKYYDGYIEELANHADTIKIVAPDAQAVALTKANILAQLRIIKGKIPKAIKRKQGLTICVSTEDFEKYEDALQEQQNRDVQNLDGAPERFAGIKIAVLSGLPENTVVVGVMRPDMNGNFWLGLNSKDDEVEVKLSQLQANSELWFIKMLFKADVQVGFPEEVVLYQGV